MRNTEIASRYSQAIFEIAQEQNKHEEFLNGLKAAQTAFFENEELSNFVNTPLMLSTAKEKVLKSALQTQQLPEELNNFLLLLAKKGRLNLLHEIVIAFQNKEDEKNQVTRGIVKTAKPLSSDQKNEIQKSIESTTKKKVELQYQEDTNLIGGIVAQVGSLTFDDSLSAHLRRIKDDLTRRRN